MESYIYQLNAHIKSKRLANIGVRYATLWDLLLAVKLLRSGTFEGAIADQFTQGRGGLLKLFKNLAKLIYMQCVGRIGKTECLVVVYSGTHDVGLMQLECSGNRVGAQNYVIKMVAMLNACSRRRYPILVLNAMIDLLSEGSTLQAHCNPQSNALMHFLRELTFVTDGVQPKGMTLFTYQKAVMSHRY